MRTNFSSSNAAFSDKAHIAAQTQIYPLVFNTSSENITYETVTLSGNPDDQRSKILDGELAIDRVINVSLKTFPFPLSYTVQEDLEKRSLKNIKTLQ